MSIWLNNKKIINKKITKPCKLCGYCPYGQLVEEFPLKQINKYSCKVFRHDCPVFYHAEQITEEEHLLDKKTQVKK